jgi:hypothetical protein
MQADDSDCLAMLELVLMGCRGIGADRAADLIAQHVTKSRCPMCGGNRFARLITSRFHRRRTNVVTSDRLRCISGRTIEEGPDRTPIVCAHESIIVKGKPTALDPSPKVIRKAMEIMRAAFTPIEEAQHRDIRVGRWTDAGSSDAWTDATHDGTLAPRVEPQVVSLAYKVGGIHSNDTSGR